jgi:hypothetical protein
MSNLGRLAKVGVQEAACTEASEPEQFFFFFFFLGLLALAGDERA